jgi:hypothetical protein
VGYSHLAFDQAARVARVSGERTDRQDQRDCFGALRVDVTGNLILKVEQHLISGQAGAIASENPDGIAEHWSVTVVKASFVF